MKSQEKRPPLVQNSGTSAIKDMKRPNNQKEVRSFLGLTGYYRSFIKDYAKIAIPLINLTKEDVKFEWNKDHEESFALLKTKLIEAPILSYPDFDHEFQLQTDASGYG